MKKKHVLFIFILFVAFSLISCTSVTEETRIISPHVAALVVAPEPASDDSIMDEKTSDTMLGDKETEVHYDPGAFSDGEGMTKETRDEDIQTSRPEEDVADIQTSKLEQDIADIKTQTARLEEDIADIQKSVIKEEPKDQLSELLHEFENQTVFTIQTGSYTYLANAQDHFNSIKKSLSNRELAYLRIEEIGKYYAVRLGIFDNYANAKKFLNVVEQRLHEAMILEANIKEKRLIWFMLD
jgi:hypothetical protein